MRCRADESLMVEENCKRGEKKTKDYSRFASGRSSHTFTLLQIRESLDFPTHVAAT